jgi:alkylation response protein AidB-like acyl-CoA dehydrogenase
MRQDGISVRPLTQMNGHSSFNEVFLDEALIPVDYIVGEIGGGWSVALTTLAHERRLTRTRAPQHRRDPDSRVWREAIAEATAVSEPHKWYPQRAGRVDLLVEHARASGRSDDPLVRQAAVQSLVLARAARLNAERTAEARLAGRPPGPEGSLGKLATSVIARAAARAHASMSGSSGMIAPHDGSLASVVAEILVSVPGQSIAGGTDEIQHNIIGERVLGLPKEPATDVDAAFRDVPRNL